MEPGPHTLASGWQYTCVHLQGTENTIECRNRNENEERTREKEWRPTIEDRGMNWLTDWLNWAKNEHFDQWNRGKRTWRISTLYSDLALVNFTGTLQSSGHLSLSSLLPFTLPFSFSFLSPANIRNITFHLTSNIQHGPGGWGRLNPLVRVKKWELSTESPVTWTNTPIGQVKVERERVRVREG